MLIHEYAADGDIEGCAHELDLGVEIGEGMTGRRRWQIRIAPGLAGNSRGVRSASCYFVLQFASVLAALSRPIMPEPDIEVASQWWPEMENVSGRRSVGGTTRCDSTCSTTAFWWRSLFVSRRWGKACN